MQKDTYSKPKRLPRLQTANDARHYLARLIKEVYKDEISESKAGRLGYLLNIFIKSVEVSEFDDRLKALEEKVLK